MKSRVSEDEFKRIKWASRISKNVRTLAHRFKRSEATITRIMASKTFEKFKELVKAEHPPINHSTLGNRVSDLEVRVGRLEGKDG